MPAEKKTTENKIEKQPQEGVAKPEGKRPQGKSNKKAVRMEAKQI